MTTAEALHVLEHREAYDLRTYLYALEVIDHSRRRSEPPFEPGYSHNREGHR